MNEDDNTYNFGVVGHGEIEDCFRHCHSITVGAGGAHTGSGKSVDAYAQTDACGLREAGKLTAPAASKVVVFNAAHKSIIFL